MLSVAQCKAFLQIWTSLLSVLHTQSNALIVSTDNFRKEMFRNNPKTLGFLPCHQCRCLFTSKVKKDKNTAQSGSWKGLFPFGHSDSKHLLQ